MHAYFGDKGGAKKLKRLLSEGAKSSALHAKMGKKEVSGAEKVYKYMDRRSRARKAGTHVQYEDK